MGMSGTTSVGIGMGMSGDGMGFRHDLTIVMHAHGVRTAGNLGQPDMTVRVGTAMARTQEHIPLHRREGHTVLPVLLAIKTGEIDLGHVLLALPLHHVPLNPALGVCQEFV